MRRRHRCPRSGGPHHGYGCTGTNAAAAVARRCELGRSARPSFPNRLHANLAVRAPRAECRPARAVGRPARSDRSRRRRGCAGMPGARLANASASSSLTKNELAPRTSVVGIVICRRRRPTGRRTRRPCGLRRSAMSKCRRRAAWSCGTRRGAATSGHGAERRRSSRPASPGSWGSRARPAPARRCRAVPWSSRRDARAPTG